MHHSQLAAAGATRLRQSSIYSLARRFLRALGWRLAPTRDVLARDINADNCDAARLECQLQGPPCMADSQEQSVTHLVAHV